MKKIRISCIDKSVHSFRGIDGTGCFHTECNDECCRYGADIDKESYDLILKNRRIIEKEIGRKIETCFKKRWLDDEHYLGGNAIETKVGPSGFCMLHSSEGKGCALYKLVHENDLPRRMIPSICRLYPLTWADEHLTIADDIYPTCNCTKGDAFADSIFATQKKEIEDIFHIEASARAGFCRDMETRSRTTNKRR